MVLETIGCGPMGIGFVVTIVPLVALMNSLSDADMTGGGYGVTLNNSMTPQDILEAEKSVKLSQAETLSA